MNGRKYKKGVVACGHELVSQAAKLILEAGGNAFDAVTAAGFASTVVEPALTSLGGGGFMLGFEADKGKSTFFDFFVDTPGKGRKNGDLEPHFFPITVNFSNASQIFNVGLGSVAVPGTLRGLLHIHERLGFLPLAEVLTPAREYATSHVLNEQQAHFLELLKPIMTLFPDGEALVSPGGNFVTSGSQLKNPLLADYLEQIAVEGDRSFYHGDIAESIVRDMDEKNGLLTLKDLAGYQVYERDPLTINYKGHRFMTAPAPSMGGTLIAISLTLSNDTIVPVWGSADHLLSLTGRMKEVERLRSEGVTTPEALANYIKDSVEHDGDESEGRLFSRGTTHISIADSDGNCASMTCSNGEGSGYFAPHTGIMLNNMMGEDDLHPDGFHASPPGERVLSMMSPSMLMNNGEVGLVIGSGGSKRIRTAITQVLSQVVDHGRGLVDAVEAPRLYWDEDRVQIEPGFSDESIKALQENEQVHLWKKKDVYFGGVHCVIPGKEGGADSRRGGSVAEVPVADKKAE